MLFCHGVSKDCKQKNAFPESCSSGSAVQFMSLMVTECVAWSMFINCVTELRTVGPCWSCTLWPRYELKVANDFRSEQTWPRISAECDRRITRCFRALYSRNSYAVLFVISGDNGGFLSQANRYVPKGSAGDGNRSHRVCETDVAARDWLVLLQHCFATWFCLHSQDIYQLSPLVYQDWDSSRP
jgi:hypothetical protein